MARINLDLARNLSSSDRARAVRESLYHLARSANMPVQAERFEEPKQIILQEKPETFLQFAREFEQDTELHNALGVYLASIQETIDAHLQEQKNKNRLEE